jgi:predicted oxidoreductase (fatty acid repression mutant protein)
MNEPTHAPSNFNSQPAKAVIAEPVEAVEGIEEKAVIY